jgi:hypothetical protein
MHPSTSLFWLSSVDVRDRAAVVVFWQAGAGGKAGSLLMI